MTGSYEELLPLLPRIAQTWKKKNITQKMHYSEPALLYNDDGSLASPRDRRKHSSRVYNLPPWRSEEPVDLCIEAKDKEQAVFELMKRFQGNGWAWQGVSDIIPHTRADNAISKDDRPSAPLKKEEMTDSSDDSELWLDLGGVDKRVYWPEGMEAWLKPKKRARKVKVEEVQSQSDGADVDEE
jgi:UV DNA damage endonuclease